MSVKQISVFVENNPGQLEKFTGVLAESGINMLALQLAEAENFGIIRLIVNDPYEAACVIKDAGYVNSITPVLAVEIPNRPGGLHEVLTAMHESDINIQYAYAFTTGSKEAAYMIFKVKEIDKAASVLSSNGVRLLETDDIRNM